MYKYNTKDDCTYIVSVEGNKLLRETKLQRTSEWKKETKKARTIYTGVYHETH